MKTYGGLVKLVEILEIMISCSLGVPEPFINVTISWCFRGAPFCETNICVKTVVRGEIRGFHGNL